MKHNNYTKTIAITGGKGGVGKTMIATNLAIALAQANKNIILFDADLALANIDVALGLNTKLNLSHVLNGKCNLKDIIVSSYDVDILPASSGNVKLANLSLIENANIIREFSTLQKYYNMLIIDTPAGIAESTLQYCKASQEVIIVVCNEPTSIADAYAMIKNLHLNEQVYCFHIVTNMIRTYDEGKEIYTKLKMITNKFLEINLGYLGGILFDEQVKKSIQQRKPVIKKYPQAKSSLSINQIAQKINNLQSRRKLKGAIEFFFEQLLDKTLFPVNNKIM